MKANSRGKIYLSIIKLSFITLLITVISITIIFFIGVQFNLNAQIRHTNEATLKQIALDLDNIMVKKAQDAANSLVYQYPEFELIISKKLNGNQIEYKRLMEYLGGVVQYSPQIRSIYVYSDKTNLILSNTIVTDIGNRINAERLDLDWMETVQLDQYSSFWIPSRESKESPGEYSVSYVKPMSLRDARS